MPVLYGKAYRLVYIAYFSTCMYKESVWTEEGYAKLRGDDAAGVSHTLLDAGATVEAKARATGETALHVAVHTPAVASDAALWSGT